MMLYEQSMQIEQLIQAGPSEHNRLAYAQYGEFVLSWASLSQINICNKRHIVRTNQSGEMLALLWAHQLHSLEEWSHIQIGLNESGNICFLCRVHENSAISHEYMVQTLKMIEHALGMVMLRY